MSSFDSSACVFLHMKHIALTFYISAINVNGKWRLYISGKSCDSDLRFLICFMCRNTQAEQPCSLSRCYWFTFQILLVQFKNATVCLDKLECFTCEKMQKKIACSR